MTAAYKLVAKLPDGSHIKAVWNSKHSEMVTIYRVREGQIEHKEHFPDQRAADDWAVAAGVTGWRLASAIRITPFAARLGITFPEAPPTEVLLTALAKLEAGHPLTQVAAELRTHPTVARAWLSGTDPTCHEAMGWELPNLKSADVWGGNPYG